MWSFETRTGPVGDRTCRTLSCGVAVLVEEVNQGKDLLMDLGTVILIAILAAVLISVVVTLLRRERLTRRLSHHNGPEHGHDQTTARATAQAAHMGRGGGWPQG
ncbi:hypothetical protein [Cryobacterium roopkundense]|nr:hypothetical protein [Cryobacterium roopkundense]MBB5641562.1 hypothetical protein [Cryobacterium roopkundense]